MTEASTEATVTGATGAVGATGATGATSAATATGATGATGASTPLHDDPIIAKILEGLTPDQRETLLTTGGKNALAARSKEVKDAKEAASKATETARAELAQQIGKALGLVEDETVDPAKLTEQLTAKDTEAKQAKAELAVFHAAALANADARALLDSRSFMAKVAALDPTDSAALAVAITEAVTANPAFALTAERRVPNPNPALGSSASGAPDAQALSDEARKKGDWQTVVALENQKLTALAPQR